jgi:hypothetical protein
MNKGTVLLIVLVILLTACTSPAPATTLPSGPMTTPSPSPTAAPPTPTVTPLPSPTATPQPTTTTFSLDPAVTEAFPLQVGATWGYQAHIEEELAGEVQVRDEIITEQVITQTQQANLAIFILKRVGGLNPGRFYYLVWGNSVYQVPPSPRNEALQRFLADLQSDEPTLPPSYVFPLRVGASWGSVSVVPQANHGYEWYVEGQEDVDVPAGHFADCYRLVFLTSPDDTTRWFCPGVGLARLRYRHHGSVHNEDWELISYPGMTTPATKPTATHTVQDLAPGTEAVIDCAGAYPGLPGCLCEESLVGGRLAFVDLRPPFDGRPTVIDLERGGAWTLGESPAWLHSWSPSGNSLLVGGADVLTVWHYDGQNHSPISSPQTLFWAPRSSFEGGEEQLAIVAKDGSLVAACYTASDSTACGERLLLPPGSLGNDGRGTVCWSPDGWLAWSLNTDQLAAAGQWEQTLYVRPFEGKAETTTWHLSNDIREVYYQIMDWVPGTRLILAGQGMMAVSLWVDGVPLATINADTGAITELDAWMLLTPEAYAWHPMQPGLLALAEGGGRFLFANKRLALLDVISSALTYLTGEDVAAFEPAWSPDGTLLAYAAVPASPDASGNGATLEHALDGRAIYVVNPQSGQTHRLTDPGDAVDGWPQWSADGTRLLYTRQHDGYTDVRVVTLDGDSDQLLVTGLPDPTCYCGGCDWRQMLAYYPGP